MPPKKKETRGRKPKKGPMSKYMKKKMGIPVPKQKRGRKKYTPRTALAIKNARNEKKKAIRLAKGEVVITKEMTQKDKMDLDLLEQIARNVFEGVANEKQVATKLKKNVSAFGVYSKMLQNLYSGRPPREGIEDVKDEKIKLIAKATTAPGFDISKHKAMGGPQDMLTTKETKEMKTELDKVKKEKEALDKLVKERGLADPTKFSSPVGIVTILNKNFIAQPWIKTDGDREGDVMPKEEVAKYVPFAVEGELIVPSLLPDDIPMCLQKSFADQYIPSMIKDIMDIFKANPSVFRKGYAQKSLENDLIKQAEKYKYCERDYESPELQAQLEDALKDAQHLAERFREEQEQNIQDRKTITEELDKLKDIYESRLQEAEQIIQDQEEMIRHKESLSQEAFDALAEDKAQLEEELDALEGERRRLDSALTDLQTTKRELEIALGESSASAKHELDSLKKANKTLEKQLQQGARASQGLIEKISELESKLKASETIKGRVEFLDGEYKKIQSTNQELRQRLEEASGEIESLKRALKDADRDSEIKDLESRLSEALASNRELMDKVTRGDAIAEDLRGKIAEMEKEMEAEDTKLDQKSEQLDKLRSHLASLLQVNEQLEKELAEAKDKAESLEARIKSSTTSSEEATAKIAQLEQDVKDVRAQLTDKDKEIAGMRKVDAEVSEGIRKMQEERQRLEEQLEQVTVASKNTKQFFDALQKIGDLKDKTPAQIEDILAKLKSDAIAQEEQIKQLRSDAIQGKLAHTEGKRQVAELTEKLSTLDKEFKAGRKEIEKLEKELAGKKEHVTLEKAKAKSDLMNSWISDATKYLEAELNTVINTTSVLTSTKIKTALGKVTQDTAVTKDELLGLLDLPDELTDDNQSKFYIAVALLLVKRQIKPVVIGSGKRKAGIQATRVTINLRPPTVFTPLDAEGNPITSTTKTPGLSGLSDLPLPGADTTTPPQKPSGKKSDLSKYSNLSKLFGKGRH